ncbi:MAG: GNAT family N-acetyltransferase [Peptostreptococcaceae bacterium]
MKYNNKENIVTLELVKEDELSKFKKDLQESFGEAVVEEFGSLEDGPIPSDEDIEENFKAQGAVIYHILSNGTRIGGVIVSINEETQYNSLDFLFIAKGNGGKGIGYKAWKAIEEKYPETKVWETHTPYFEKRNIHFYVNKCGFKIVEYLSEKYNNPHDEEGEGLPSGEDFFRFEKIMK